jgi:hypothetical protein
LLHGLNGVFGEAVLHVPDLARVLELRVAESVDAGRGESHLQKQACSGKISKLHAPGRSQHFLGCSSRSGFENTTRDEARMALFVGRFAG